MSILLTIKESSDELIVDIPKWVTISSSEPSIIFYSLDGSDPDDGSLMFGDKIYIPTNQNPVILKYRAFYNNSFSEIYQETYNSRFEKTFSSRKGGEDGVDIFEGDEEISLYYNSEGERPVSTAVPLEDLDIKTSRTDNRGNPVGSTKSFINFVRRQVNRRYKRTSDSSDIDFDRGADVITIDGSSDASKDAQVVDIVNRPYDNMSPRSSFYIESFARESNYLNGNLVGYVYNPVSGEIIFNYFDSRENRWIKSKQKVKSRQALNLSKMHPDRNSKVFRWISNPVGSQTR